jgi:hypothetical protein
MTRQTANPADGLSVLVVGNDTLIEMLPTRPIQLARACGRVGFDLVVPLSWGDELVAQAVLAILSDRPAEPAVLCTCPIVRARLLASGPELSPAMVSVVAPPVALSRHLRASLGRRLHSLAFVGRCPGAGPPDYDLTLDPQDLRELLRSRRINPEEEPDFFEDVLPPDRRRFASLPGGCPTAEHLWHRCNERVPFDIEGRDIRLDLAQALLAPQPLLVDPGPALGCSCCGVTPNTPGRLARLAVSSLEPPRSTGSVIEPAAGIKLQIDTLGADLPRPPLLDREAERRTHREVMGSEPEGVADVRASRAPIAVTPVSALRIAPRPK